MATKKVTVKKEVFLVTYDVEDQGDPVIEFKTMAKVQEFCEAVMSATIDNEDDLNEKFLPDKDYPITDIRKDSLKVYKATLIGKPVFKMELIA